MSHKLRDLKLIQEDGNKAVELYFASLIHHATEFDMQEIIDHFTCTECREIVRLHELWTDSIANADISIWEQMFWEKEDEDQT